MSRRKQARPKSCKLEGMLEAGREEEEDSSPPSTAKTLDPGDVSPAAVTSQARDGVPGDGDTTTAGTAPDESPAAVPENSDSGPSSSRSEGSRTSPVFRCETCSAVFDSLDHFMDHRNFVCSADTGLPWTSAMDDKEDWSGSDSRSSFSPNEEEGLGSPLPIHLTEDQLEYTIGISETNPYGCQFCEKAFPRLSHLHVHERVHGDQLPFQCQRCQRMFCHKRSRDRHMKLHASERTFSCHLCDASFARNDQLKTHLQSHESDKAYQCPVCQTGYSSAAALTVHLTTHQEQRSRESESTGMSQGRELPCLLCGQSFTAVHLLQEHMAVHAAAIKVEKISCDICSEVFTSQEALDTHMDCAHYSNHPMDVDASMMLKCPMCALTFPDTLALCHHLMTHTTAGLGPDINLQALSQSEAKELSAVSPKKESSRSHTPKQSTSTSLSPSSGSGISKSSQALVCPYCLSDSFETLEVLELHMQSVHSVKSTEIYTCNYCNAPYPNLYSLHDHMNVVHRNHPGIGIKYPCSLCNNQFPSIEALSKHKSLSHSYPEQPSDQASGIDSAFCSRCSQTFPDARQLEDHMVCVHGASVDKKTGKIKGKKISKGNKENKAATSSSSSKVNPLSPTLPSAYVSGGQYGPKRVKTPSSSSTRPSASTRAATPAVPDSSTPSPTPARTPSTAATHSSESITCDQCNATFHELANFQAHMKLHLDAALAKFTCKKCGQQLASQEQLEAHLSLHYLCLATEYGCTSCMKLFSKPDELQKHLMDIHAHHLYRCALCKEIFDSKVNIQVHFAIKHSNECKLFKCTQCSNIFRSEMEWQVHVRVNHLHLAKPYRCLFCAESFTSEMELQCHLTTHSKPFRCPMCEQTFHIEYLLDRHMQTEHGDADTKSAVNVSFNPSTSPALANISIKEEADSSLTVPQQLMPMISPRPPSHNSDTRKSLSPAVPQPSPSPLSVSVASAVWKNSDPIHVCNICDSRFTQQALLAIHKAQEHGLKMVSSGGNSSVSTAINSSVSPQGKAHSNSVSPGGSSSQSPRDKILQQNQTLVSVLTADTTTSSGTAPAMSCAFCSQTFKNQTECDKHMRIHANSTSLKCNICDETFPSSATLAEHKLQHCKIQQGNVCFVCKLALKTEEQFYSHAQEHGYQGSLLQCIVCRQTLASVVELQMHGKHHFQIRPSFYTCCVCLKTFDSKENLVSKLNASGRTYYVCKPCYHGESPLYTCPHCSEKFASRAQLEAHTATHLSPSGSSQSVASSVSALSAAAALSVSSLQTERSLSALSAVNSLSGLSSTSLMSGLTSTSLMSALTSANSLTNPVTSALPLGASAAASTAQTFTCIKCQESFTSEYEIQLHVANHMLQEGVTHECKLCNLVFVSPAKLQCHLIEHTYKHEPEIKCPVCRQVFATPSEIQTHALEHGAAGRHHTCRQCSQRFFFSAELDNHVLIYNHSPAPASDHSARYECGECNKLFSSATALANHRKTHERIRCTLCTQSFSTVQLMQRHFLAMHAGATPPEIKYNDTEKGKKCTLCKQQFTTQEGLQAHLKTHKTGSSKLSCPMCDKTFSQMKNLTLHLRSHSGDKPHQCSVCQKRFSREENMRAHMKSHTLPNQPLVCPLCNQSFSQKMDITEHLKTHFTNSEDQSTPTKQSAQDPRTSEPMDVSIPTSSGTSSTLNGPATIATNHVNGSHGNVDSESSLSLDYRSSSDHNGSVSEVMHVREIKTEVMS